MDLDIRHDTHYEKYCKWSDTNSETIVILLSLEYCTPFSQSDLRTRKNCCINKYIWGFHPMFKYPDLCGFGSKCL